MASFHALFTEINAKVSTLAATIGNRIGHPGSERQRRYPPAR
jgi:hypothetical protein